MSRQVHKLGGWWGEVSEEERKTDGLEKVSRRGCNLLTTVEEWLTFSPFCFGELKKKKLVAWRRASLNSDGCAEVKSGLGSRWRGEKGMQDEGRGRGATALPLKLKFKKKRGGMTQT